jgi:ABC-type antimicrobial peptide transport system permease subunit
LAVEFKRASPLPTAILLEWGWLAFIGIILGIVVGWILLIGVFVSIMDWCTKLRHSPKQQTSSSPRDTELGQLGRNPNVSAEPPQYPGT